MEIRSKGVFQGHLLAANICYTLMLAGTNLWTFSHHGLETFLTFGYFTGPEIQPILWPFNYAWWE
jgi:hypothetical protein